MLINSRPSRVHGLMILFIILSQLESNLLINCKCTLLQQKEREWESVPEFMQNVIVPNKLAELVKFLHFLLHTHIFPILPTPHTPLCTHLIHNWHGSSLRPGEQCKAKQRNDSSKVRPHFAEFCFPFYFTFLFRHFFFYSFP